MRPYTAFKLNCLSSKFSWACLSLAAAILMVSGTANANLIVINNRYHDNKLTFSLCEKFKTFGLSVSSQCSVASDKTLEFGDGCTFAQINNNLYGEDVLVVVPSIANSATNFMEALIKIRTAKNLGARKIYAFATEKLSSFEMSLMAKAGAQEMLTLNPTDGEIIHSAEWEKSAIASSGKALETAEPSLENAYVFTSENSDFAENLGQKLSIQTYHKESRLTEALFESSNKLGQTLIVVSQWTIEHGNQKFLSDLKFIYDVRATSAERGSLSPHIIYVTPYLPYARGDKIDHEGTTVSGKLIADLIETVRPNLVSFARLHAAQSQGFFNTPTIHISGRKTVNQQLENLQLHAIISPDAGFQKEATKYADELDLPVYVLNKQRDSLTGESHLRTIGDIDIKGKNIAIIDDETASGGTLAIAAEYLKSQGAANVYAVVTHLTGSAAKAIGSGAIEKIFVTNTLESYFKSDSKVKVLDMTAEFADALKRFLGLSSKNTCAKFLR